MSTGPSGLPAKASTMGGCTRSTTAPSSSPPIRFVPAAFQLETVLCQLLNFAILLSHTLFDYRLQKMLKPYDNFGEEVDEYLTSVMNKTELQLEDVKNI